MEPRQEATALAEWRAHWPLAFATMLGVSTIGLQSYGFMPFAGAVEKAFGWSRADVMWGVTVAMFLGIFLNMIVGLIVDRFGSRRVAIIGLFTLTGTFALLGTASGTMTNWTLLWALLAVGVVLCQSTVWMPPLAARFDKSRGLAMALALSGAPLSLMLLPALGTWLIGEIGWRQAFAAVGAIWLVAVLPMVLLFFRDARGPAPAGGKASPALAHDGLTFRQGIRTRAFLGLIVSFGAFSFYNMTISTNLQLMFTERGLTPMAAAGLLTVQGMIGMAARLSVGFLLDRFPGHVIGTFTQVLPVLACGLLLLAPPSYGLLLFAVFCFGLATGAEIDVALYLATRHFGLKAFGALFSGIITVGAMNAALGPYVAGWLHDRSGSYDSLLATIAVIMAVGAAGMFAVGRPKHAWRAGGH
ncbi:MAG: MFS transporter [Novosphingobium sp.]